MSIFLFIEVKPERGIINVDEEKVQKALKQLKGLKYNKKSEEELRTQAEALVASKEQLESIDVESLFTLRSEQKQAVLLLKKYLTDYTIETVSDKNTLCQLIYLEILNLRLQESLNKIHNDTKTMPPATVELIHRNLEQVAKLKNLLGVTKNAKDQNKQDGFSYLQLLKKKYKKWLEENQASRTLWCPHCAKATLLKIKMDEWEAQKHPFFRDRILGNVHLIELFKAGKLTREDLAKVFEVSPDYINWLVAKGWKLLSEEEELKIVSESQAKELEKQIEGG